MAIDMKEKTNKPVVKLLAMRKVTTKKGEQNGTQEVFNYEIVSENSLAQVDRYIFEKGYKILGFQNIPAEADKDKEHIRKIMLKMQNKYRVLIEDAEKSLKTKDKKEKEAKA